MLLDTAIRALPWEDSEPPAQFLPHCGQRSIAQAIESTAKLKKFVAPKLAKTVGALPTSWHALAESSTASVAASRTN